MCFVHRCAPEQWMRRETRHVRLVEVQRDQVRRRRS